MEYFQQFPTILYTFDPNLFDYRSVVNIFARVKILDAVLQNSLVYYQYAVKDSDTSEIIASKYYGDTKRHWMVMFANQVIDPYFDMPLKENDLENNIILQYGSLAIAQATLFRVQQFVNVTTTFAGTSNTISYQSTLEDSYSYDFTTGQLVSITLPTIVSPILDQGTTLVGFPDGTTVKTDTVWVAQSAYDYYIQQNEEKRQIQLLDNQYATSLEKELQSLLSST
jgi:Base plate wedge protein 53